MKVLSSELRAFVKPGLAGAITSASVAERRPEIVRAWAVRCHPEVDALEIYVPLLGAARFTENVATSRRAALNLVALPSYRSRTFKGVCSLSKEQVDPQFLEACLLAQGAAFSGVGMPNDAVDRMLPRHARVMVALRLEVESVFDQSPKVGAGARL